jgi:ketosteroid isomerase-like protein
MKEEQMLVEFSVAEANVDLLKKAFAEFKKGNIQAVIDSCIDDVQWKTYENPTVPFAGTYKGKGEVKKYFKLLVENVTIKSFVQHEFIAQGETVVVLSHQKATVKKTSKSIEQDMVQVFKFRNDLIASVTTFNDTRLAEKAFS